MEAVTLEKEYCVEMQSISKHFGGVQALKNVDFRLRRGEVRALLGENGAGKSTTITLLQQNSSGGFANIRLQSNNGKTEGILTTIYKEDGKFSMSEMVKYQVKKLELNEKNIMTLEFYLSDQAELQTDGTMEFQC